MRYILTRTISSVDGFGVDVGRGANAGHTVAAMRVVTELPHSGGDPASSLGRLLGALEHFPDRVVACSGGVDSLTLATVAHRAAPGRTTVAHTVTPAVPARATARVVAYAKHEGWSLEVVRSAEFDDERYLANPTDRCYYCKTNLYDAIDGVTEGLMEGVVEGVAVDASGAVVLSGANTDDLGEYRPGLIAAAEHCVHHPYVEAGLSKGDVREIARDLALEDADLPASPCLASRLYTGTRVTAERLRAVEIGEETIGQLTGVQVSRCRIREDDVVVEVSDEDRDAITDDTLDVVAEVMRAVCPSLRGAVLDPLPYRPGRAIIQVH